jgi:hypothetical protein
MATKIFFASAQANNLKINLIQDVLSSSTNTRIIIINQSTFFRTGHIFNLAFVMGRRNTEYPATANTDSLGAKLE